MILTVVPLAIIHPMIEFSILVAGRVVIISSSSKQRSSDEEDEHNGFLVLCLLYQVVALPCRWRWSSCSGEPCRADRKPTDRAARLLAPKDASATLASATTVSRNAADISKHLVVFAGILCEDDKEHCGHTGTLVGKSDSKSWRTSSWNTGYVDFDDLYS